MIRGHTTVAVLGTLMFFSSTAFTFAQPAPRPPIGPREMIPPSNNPLPGSSQRLPDDRIRIVNVGTQRLFIAFWDADSWRQVSIGSGQPTDIVCLKCQGTITVAFHNGKETKYVEVNGGGTYILGWSDQGSVWVLSPSADR
jgi:hypothetical protein